MQKTKNFIFTTLHVITWMIFVGLCIDLGGIIVNFVFNILYPEFIGRLYQKLDLSLLYQQRQSVFFITYAIIIIIAFLKVKLFYTVINMLLKLNLDEPFNEFISKKILKIASITFSIGIVSFIGRWIIQFFHRQGFEMSKFNDFWIDSHTFIMMSAIIYIIAQIFNRGVELQHEKDLTV
ncbi:MAG TPA: DUF2975 domain-containing protein [Saprospiraceae bacterium]|jgi:hypothetical protein|nr:DUF2975 domain-containing protein [Saprospiraceae bacterium]HRO07244.1 DUF2975 domain-containing protein [Saprospiraceae bacterium]HRP40527.1 DUF2975 domain-containing protein [Saprospiraceae bacterium]